MELKDRIRRAREAAGLTQAELAQRVRVETRTVRNWEAGRVPRNAIGAIENALGIDLSDPSERGTSPRLDEATDGQLLAALAGRLADRDRTVLRLQAAIEDAKVEYGAPPARWAARVREAAPDAST